MTAVVRGQGRGNLPAEVSSFVDRRRELAEAKRLLSTNRLLTLTGVGGVGKTRLALRVAGDLRRALADGVWLVELAELRDARLVVDAVAAALELHDLTRRSPLDALDRLPRLTAPAAGAGQLRARRCCVRGTRGRAAEDQRRASGPRDQSRAARRPGRGRPGGAIAVGPGSGPPRVAARRVGVGRGDAVRRAGGDHDPRFRPRRRQPRGGRPDLPAVGRDPAGDRTGCGPTACALRRRDRPPAQPTATGCSAPAPANAPERHQTLRACIEWSHDLCSPAERLLWARLSVFSGGFELDAAEAVGAGDGLRARDVADVVASLVEKSILLREPHGSRVRYRLLETIGEYGQQRLQQTGQVTAYRRRHRDWCEHLAGQANAEWVSGRQTRWLARLNRDHQNLQAALEFCLTEPGEEEAALRILARGAAVLLVGAGPDGRGTSLVPTGARPARRAEPVASERAPDPQHDRPRLPRLRHRAPPTP